MKVKLRKRYRPDVEGGLRTEEVVGDAPYPPRHGGCFVMTAPPLEGGDFRVINTSKVVELSLGKKGANDFYTIRTQTGSVYTVEVLD